MILKTIILVGENFIDNYMHHKLLESMNIANKILEFSNPPEVIDYLKIMHELNDVEIKTSTDLIIFDTNSKMDVWGFIECLKGIYSNHKHYTKIIIVSKTLNKKEIERLKSEQLVAGFINSSLNRDTILNCFKSIPELRHFYEVKEI